MIPLNRVSKIFQDDLETPATSTQLKTDILKELSQYNEITLDDVQRVLSRYQLRELKLRTFPEDSQLSVRDVGSIIQITREDSWDYTGELIDIWYKFTKYSEDRIENVLYMMENNPEPLDRDLSFEIIPKIYDRIILKDENKGILIVPYVRGTKIIKKGV